MKKLLSIIAFLCLFLTIKSQNNESYTLRVLTKTSINITGYLEITNINSSSYNSLNEKLKSNVGATFEYIESKKYAKITLVNPTNSIDAFEALLSQAGINQVIYFDKLIEISKISDNYKSGVTQEHRIISKKQN